MDYKRTAYKTRTVKEPNKAHPGTTNPNYKHGGYVIDLLTDKEVDDYERAMKEYKKACPYLFEDPFLSNMVHDYQLMKIRKERLERFIFDMVIPMKEKLGAYKLLDQLVRTMGLYTTRFGRTFVSRQRMQKKRQRKTALELITEES